EAARTCDGARTRGRRRRARLLAGIEEVWPRTRGQRCWVHKTANVLNKLPKSQQSKAKRALQEIWIAETKKDALVAFDAFVETWERQIRQGGRVLEQGSRRAAVLLRLPGRALEASAHNQRHRTLVRDGAPPHGALQGMSLEQHRARHDLQARRGRREKLASPQWAQPVAETHSRCKVHRRNRGRQIASSSRCRLIPSVTKIRR